MEGQSEWRLCDMKEVLWHVTDGAVGYGHPKQEFQIQNQDDMKKSVFILLGLFVCLQAGWAQNTVESIRKRYSNIKEYISSKNEDNPNDGATWGEYYHLEARMFLPASGGHKENLYMYWDEREEDKVYPSHYITFATTKYNYSAMEYYEEFMYDEDGKVAFIYAYTPCHSFSDNQEDMQYEMRFYFSREKLIKAIIKKRKDVQSPYTEEFNGNALKSLYAPYMQEMIDKAGKIRQMFISIERETYDYSE